MPNNLGRRSNPVKPGGQKIFRRLRWGLFSVETFRYCRLLKGHGSQTKVNRLILVDLQKHGWYRTI